MKIYISGKITGTTDFAERFAKAEEHLRKQGFDVINPVKECADIPEDASWEIYMRRCVKLLADCKYIYLLKGWDNSKGAIVEKWLAHSLGIETMFENFVK